MSAVLDRSRREEREVRERGIQEGSIIPVPPEVVEADWADLAKDPGDGEWRLVLYNQGGHDRVSVLLSKLLPWLEKMKVSV